MALCFEALGHSCTHHGLTVEIGFQATTRPTMVASGKFSRKRESPFLHREACSARWSSEHWGAPWASRAVNSPSQQRQAPRNRDRADGCRGAGVGDG